MNKQKRGFTIAFVMIGGLILLGFLGIRHYNTQADKASLVLLFLGLVVGGALALQAMIIAYHMIKIRRSERESRARDEEEEEMKRKQEKLKS